MVLYNSIYERFKSVLLYGDDGEYLEERVLLNQLSMFIDFNALDEYFLSLLKHTNVRLLNDNEKSMINDNLWKWIEAELKEIIPEDDYLFDEFKDRFETRIPSDVPNDRLSRLQQTLMVYFIENLKNKRLENVITDEKTNEELKEYKERLIAPNSSVLDNPEMNLGLDESIKFYDIKLDEYQNAIPKNNVK